MGSIPVVVIWCEITDIMIVLNYIDIRFQFTKTLHGYLTLYWIFPQSSFDI